VEKRTVDGREYTFMRFKSDTLTNSGYDVRPQNIVAATEWKRRTYVCMASARGDQYNDKKEQTLAYIAASFRVS
jgi:hypothetical protein